MEDTAFCIWRKNSDDQWHRGNFVIPEPIAGWDGAPREQDGSDWLLSCLDGEPEDYLEWASHYYLSGGDRDRRLTLDHVRRVFAHEPLTPVLVKEINPALTLADLQVKLDDIGYPQHRK